MTPADIRKHLRHTRNQLSDTQQTEHAQSALEYFIKLISGYSKNNTPKKIALFLSQDGELGTQKCIEYLWQETQHQVFLPVLETKDDWHMGFAEYTPQSKMANNQFGILEPNIPHARHIDGEALDLVLMPLVGFDDKGNRLGMGGGYYDRTFAFKLKGNYTTPKLVGWAHSCQKTEKLPKESWDVPLDGVLTEHGIIEFETIVEN